MIWTLAFAAFATPPGPPMHVDMVIDRLWDGSPATPDEVVHVRLRDGGSHLVMTVDAPYHGDPAPSDPPGPMWQLWNYEVVELFILGVGEPARYLEVEVGPHGHHIVIDLVGPRKVGRSHLPLDLRVNIQGGRWTAEARIPREYLPAGATRANAYTIHGTGASRRYLAWSPVPGPGPDFHRIEHFPEVRIP